MIDNPEINKKTPVNLLTKRIDDVDLGRKSPQSVEMEKAILAAIIIDKDGIDIAMEILKPESFYIPSHQKIFAAAIKISERLEPIDIAILSEQLSKDGALESCGGAQYIIELTNTIASSANLEYHCRIVAQKFIQRELIRLGNETILNAYSPTKDVFEVIENIENKISSIFNESSIDPVDGTELFEECLEKIAELKANPRDGMHGVDTGNSELNEITGGWRNGDLIIIAGRPGMGKTAAAISQLTSHDGTSAFFSLEMPEAQIVYRLMSGESRIPYSKIEKGEVSDAEFNKLINTRKIFEKIVIDDSHSTTISALKRKIKKIKSHKDDLKLVVIDYLQLLKPNERKGNREQEISQISQGLKIIAKEFDIPVIALAQLSRSVEARTDKRPMLSDLRECLSIETSMIYTDSKFQTNPNSRINLLSLHENKIKSMQSENIPKTKNIVYRLKTKTGRYIDCTSNHQILTTDGYKALKDIDTTDSIAIACGWENNKGRYIQESRFIGWMLGNGCMYGYNCPGFITNDESIASDFRNFLFERFGHYPKDHPHYKSKVFQYDCTNSSTGNRTSGGNVVTKWLKENDLWGNKAKDKHIPNWFLEEADTKSIYELIQGLWETDGSIAIGKKKTSFSYSTTSLTLANQIIYLLAKIGIIANIDEGVRSAKATTDCYKVTLLSGIEQEKFRSKIALNGVKGDRLKSVKTTEKQSNQLNKLGRNTTLKIAEIVSSIKNCKHRVRIHGGRRITKRSFERIISNHKSEFKNYEWLCSDSMFWDGIKSIVEIGEVEIFDRNVPQSHNFVVNGIIVHNSGAIEQDADMVIFAYRPEYYDKDAKDEDGNSLKGVAEMIVAKNRSGGTGTAKCKFIGELMKLENFTDEVVSLVPPSSNFKPITSSPDFEKSFLGDGDDF